MSSEKNRNEKASFFKISYVALNLAFLLMLLSPALLFLPSDSYFNAIHDKLTTAKSSIGFTDFYGDSERLSYEKYLSDKLNAITLFHKYQSIHKSSIDDMNKADSFDNSEKWILNNENWEFNDGYFILVIRPFKLLRNLDTSQITMDSICQKLSIDGVSCGLYDSLPLSIKEKVSGKHSVAVYFEKMR